ncbi:hypothetical protein RQP46_007343 [Phenoliferia psychrophenolica]
MLVNNLVGLAFLATLPGALALPTLSLRDLLKVKDYVRYGRCNGMVDCLPLLATKPQKRQVAATVCVGPNDPVGCTASTATTTPLVAVAATASVLGIGVCAGLQLCTILLSFELSIVLKPGLELGSHFKPELGIFSESKLIFPGLQLFVEPHFDIAIICNIEPSCRCGGDGLCTILLSFELSIVLKPGLELGSHFKPELGIFSESKLIFPGLQLFVEPHFDIAIICNIEPSCRCGGDGLCTILLSFELSVVLKPGLELGSHFKPELGIFSESKLLFPGLQLFVEPHFDIAVICNIEPSCRCGGDGSDLRSFISVELWIVDKPHIVVPVDGGPLCNVEPPRRCPR